MTAQDDAVSKAEGALIGAQKPVLEQLVEDITAADQAQITDLTTKLAASDQQVVVLSAQTAQDAQDLAIDKDTISTLQVQHASDQSALGQAAADKAALQAKYDAYVKAHPDPTPSGPGDLPGWKLDMVEEFDTLNPDRWKPYKGAVNTDHCYNDPAAVTVSGGQLVITASPKAQGGRSWTSGYLNGPGAGNVPKYTLPDFFRVEVKCKVPWFKGAWAAPLWVRPVDLKDAAEIDVLETYADKPGQLDATVHVGTSYGDASHKMTHVNTTAGALKNTDPADWHTYVLEKTKGQMVFYVDGVKVGAASSSNTTLWAQTYEAGRRWFLKSCLEIGRATSDPDAGQTEFGSMVLDHVYVWLPTS